jgi:cytochrome c-type biogenesis protein CcmH
VSAFYLLAMALGLLAAALLARPLWWPFGAAARSGSGDQVQALARQLRQLGDLHGAGAIGAEAHAEGKALLERKLLAAVTGADESSAMAARPTPSPRLAAGLAVFLFVVAGAGYLRFGAPAHLDLGPGSGAGALARAGGEAAQPNEGPASAPHALAPEQVAAMVDKLAEQLKAKPDDGDGWLMLARSQVVLGKHAQAVESFKQAARLRPDDANLFADYADAKAMADGRSLEGEPTKLVQRALQLDANNPKALALAGSAAFDRRDYAGAVAYWERLVKLEPADAGYAEQVRGGIAEARQLAGMPAATTPTADSAPGLLAASVSGTVELAPALKSRTSPDDTVFVYARAMEGPRMPLAILRKQVRDLPLRFTLDDDMAMSPDARLSGASRVVVGARISKSGDAMPRSGDLQGQLDAVAVGARQLKVEINQEVTR